MFKWILANIRQTKKKKREKNDGKGKRVASIRDVFDLGVWLLKWNEIKWKKSLRGKHTKIFLKKGQ